jgi:hypothetical protein
MLPKKIHRLILSIIGLREYAKEENLNLMSKKNIKYLINDLKKNDFNISTFEIKLFGITSNLIVLGVHKNI